MKKMYFRMLMLLMALSWVTPGAEAASTTYTRTYSWGTTNANYGNGYWMQGAPSTDGNGTEGIYTVPRHAGTGSPYFISGTTYTQGYVLRKSGVTNFSGGDLAAAFPVNDGGSTYFRMGPAIASDNSGTVWASTIASAYGYNSSDKALRSVAYYTVRPTPRTDGATQPYNTTGTRSGINLSSYNIGRSSLMSAWRDSSTDLVYLWFADVTNQKAVRVEVINSSKTVKSVTKFDIPSGYQDPDYSYVVQYSATEVMYNFGRGCGRIYKGVIDETAKTIDWTYLGKINTCSLANYTGSAGATMFRMGGQEYLVWSNTASTIQICNLTNGETDEITTGLTSAASFVNHHITVHVADDKMSAKMYVYVPGAAGGAHVYNLVAILPVEPVTNLTATLTKEEDMTEPDTNKPGRQNMVLSWDTNSNWTSQPTGYKVQWQRVLLDPTTGADVSTSAWNNLGTVTGTSCVHNDVSYYKSGSVNYPTRYRYRVTPLFSDATGKEAEVNNDRNPEFIPIAPNWIYLFGEESYDGLCMTQLYWEYPRYGLKPDSYDIVRDDVVINGDEHVAAFVYVDYNAKAGHNHSYKIRTHYNGLDEKGYAYSTERSTQIGSRDWSKPKYKITEIYNFDVMSSTGQMQNIEFESAAHAGNFNVRDCYPQASFWNGRWYISQMYDDQVDRRLHDPSNSMYVSGNSWTTYINECVAKGSVASVLVFDADNQDQAYGKMKGGKKLPIDLRVYSNRGVAVDDAGNIFVRGISSPSTTVASNGYRYTHEFEYPMTYGVIFKNNGNDSYTQYSVDFASAGLNFSELSQTTLGPVDGRTDYFSMKGNVFSSEGAYLYLAPTQTKAAYVIKLTASGSTIKVEKVGTYFEHGINQDTRNGEKPYGVGIENYAFPVRCNGREDQFIHNIRSNVYRNLKLDNSGTVTYDEKLSSNPSYSWITLASAPYSYNVSGVEGYAPATPGVNAEGRLYDIRSRINNAGGCTLEFNGELFVITPVCQYSINTGSFYVGRGYRKTISIDPETGVATRVGPDKADLCNVVPVASVYQTDEATAAFANANGMWIHAEVADIAKEAAMGLDADTDKNGVADYAYIYIYSPGKRFAKYRLEPDALFPPSPSELEVKPEYEREYDANDPNPGGSIVGYDAVVTWDPMEYEYNVPNSQGVKEGNYSVYSYTVTLLYADGTPVLDDNGQPLTAEVPVYDGSSTTNVVLDENGKIIDYTYTFENVDLYDADGNVITYLSQVVVNYRGEDNTVASGKEISSVETEAEDSNDYDTAAPGGTVNIGLLEEWSDWDGDKEEDEDDGYWNSYTIELEPTNPAWESDQRKEPVSYYTIDVSSTQSDTNDATNKSICEFYLYDPIVDGSNVTGLTPNGDGYVFIQDCKIPGDYQFDPTDEHPDIYWYEKDYTGKTGEGGDGQAPEDDGKINPEEWSYRVTAEYAAENENLRKIESGTMQHSDKPTDAEEIEIETVFTVYPNPATSVVNVRSSSAIETVAIYNMAGVEVKAVVAGGVNEVAVGVDDLAEGYYILKVNGKTPVKFMVK